MPASVRRSAKPIVILLFDCSSSIRYFTKKWSCFGFRYYDCCCSRKVHDTVVARRTDKILVRWETFSPISYTSLSLGTFERHLDNVKSLSFDYKMELRFVLDHTSQK